MTIQIEVTPSGTVAVEVVQAVIDINVAQVEVDVIASGPPGPPGTGGGGGGGGVIVDPASPIPDGIDVIWVDIDDTTGGVTTDHGSLSGLSDPDHPIAAIQGLQAALDGKAATTHTHPSTSDYRYVYDPLTTMADPGTGDVRTNTAVGTPATQISFSEITNLGIDASDMFSSLTTGDMIYFQQLDNANNWGRYQISGSPTDNVTWWLVPVTGIEQHGSIAKNQTVLVRFTYGTGGGGGGGTGVTDHGLLTGLTDPDHPIAAVQGLQAALDAKAATSHSHVLGDLPLSLATDAEVSTAISTHAATPGHEVLSTTTPAALGTAAVGNGTTVARANHVHAMPNLNDLTDVATAGASDGQSLVYTSGNWGPATVSSGGGVTDHGLLSGLTDDDHTQYYNQSRGDARYSQTAHTHTQAQSHGTPDTDSSTTSLHHTLGAGSTQAAAGNHLHAGVYDPAGTASSAVTAHVALSNPHDQYLQPSEIVAGANVTVDTSTTPGSAIIATTVAEGPAGPAGPPGGAYLWSQWTFNQTTTAPPASGGLRLNNTTFATSTLLWISETDRDGLDRSAGLSVAVVGDQLMLQSQQGRAVFNITSVTDSGTYRTFGVTLADSSGTRPAASGITTVYIISAGAVANLPAGGTTGQVLSKNSATDYDTGWTTPATGGVSTSRALTAGNGLTGGGDLSADRTFDVGAGTGITVTANAVAADIGTSSTQVAAGNHLHTGTYWIMWSGTQTAYNAIGTKDPNTLYCITGA